MSATALKLPLDPLALDPLAEAVARAARDDVTAGIRDVLFFVKLSAPPGTVCGTPALHAGAVVKNHG